MTDSKTDKNLKIKTDKGGIGIGSDDLKYSLMTVDEDFKEDDTSKESTFTAIPQGD